MTITKTFVVVLISLLCLNVYAQYTPFHQWTLLPQDQMDLLIGEPSGETALNHAIEMVGYQRNRPASEYGKGTFREGLYVLEKLKEYGFDNAKIERFEGRKTWDGIRGELWEVDPNKKKLADYDDIALSLAQGSQPTDVTAQLVWVEEGREKDLKDLDVNGKIVVTSSSVSRVHNLAVRKGAVGVIAFGSSRELDAPTAIPASGIYGSNATFGFYLTPREGYKLRDRLIRGEKITVHALVESQELEYDLQVPTCVIPGTDPEAGEIILSAHIYEGYTKQGANDNVSGSAVILEIARSLNQMFADGRLPRSKRGIRFIWVPEYSGTIPWVNANRDIVDRTLCNLNLDMVGLHLKSNDSFFSLMRTTYGNPHYVNDVMENYFVYMGEVNREILANRGYSRIVNQVIAPSGSDDPFYYQIEQHYGASDHEVFNHWSTHVPGVMLITWPDLYYHTSEDIPNKLDPTQLKRAAVIAAAGAYTIASADENMANQIVATSYGYGTRRMGIELNRCFELLSDATEETFENTSKMVMANLKTAFANESATLASVQELAPESKKLQSRIHELQAVLSQNEQSYMRLITDQIGYTAQELGVAVPDLKPGSEEKEAMKIVPSPTEKVKPSGFGVERAVRSLSDEIKDKYPTKRMGSTTELCALIDGKNTALDIKQKLDAQYKIQSDLQSVVNYLYLLKEAGLVEFEEKLVQSIR